jgi:NADP-reducing hydrogenase subunit HndC
MKAYRSMVLVTSGPASMQHGAQELYQRLQEEIDAFGLADEISLTTVSDIGRIDAIPMVIVYPEAVLYGPVTPDQAHYLVEEHLYKGRIAEDLRAPVREMSGPIAWLTSPPRDLAR